ncbi:Retrovirus-related Pol polyprotein from transposon RE1 [Linum grandiflorum]
MWKHLHGLHSQTNASRKFELETEIARLHQGELDVSAYYQAAIHLWNEQDLLTAASKSADVSYDVLKERASSRLMQFLMKLKPDFEGIRAFLLYRNITDIGEVIGELIREETRLRSQAQIDIHSTAPGSAFAVQPSKPQFHRTPSGEIIFHFCKEPGHIQIHCKKRNICNYCKKPGHMIGDCPILAKCGRARPLGSGSSTGRAARLVTTTSCSFPFDNSSSTCLGYSVKLSDWDLWHRRLGDPNATRLLIMFRNKWLSDNIVSNPNHDCVPCVEAKLSQNSFASSTSSYSDPFDLVHTDIWGPSPVTSRMGFRYFALFIDHKTRYTWVYFLKQRSDLLSVAKEFIQMVQTQLAKLSKLFAPILEENLLHIHCRCCSVSEGF